jgi:hypothetical protein
VRVPPLPKHSDPLGNGSSAYNGADVVSNAHAHGAAKNDIAFRRSAFDAFPNARWIFYVGRPTRPGEKAKVVGLDGPGSARAASRGGCQGLIKEVPTGHCRLDSAAPGTGAVGPAAWQACGASLRDEEQYARLTTHYLFDAIPVDLSGGRDRPN